MEVRGAELQGLGGRGGFASVVGQGTHDLFAEAADALRVGGGVGAAGEQIGEALRTSGLPSVDMHYTSNVISRACSCRDKTQAFVVGAKQFSMKLAMIALQHMVEDPEWHAHDA